MSRSSAEIALVGDLPDLVRGFGFLAPNHRAPRGSLVYMGKIRLYSVTSHASLDCGQGGGALVCACLWGFGLLCEPKIGG